MVEGDKNLQSEQYYDTNLWKRNTLVNQSQGKRQKVQANERARIVTGGPKKPFMRDPHTNYLILSDQENPEPEHEWER